MKRGRPFLPMLKCFCRSKEYNSYELPFGVSQFHHRQIPWLAKHVRVGNIVLVYPDFIVPYGTRNNSECPEDHKFWYARRIPLRWIFTKSVCFHLHRLFEMPLVKFRDNYLRSGRRLPMKRSVYQIVGFFLGLNCGFGMKACVQFSYWMLRYGGRPVAVKTFKEFLEEKEQMKTVICPKCGRTDEVGDKVERKHCLNDGYLMREVAG